MVSFEGQSCVSYGKKSQWKTKQNDKNLGVFCAAQHGVFKYMDLVDPRQN